MRNDFGSFGTVREEIILIIIMILWQRPRILASNSKCKFNQLKCSDDYTGVYHRNKVDILV